MTAKNTEVEPLSDPQEVAFRRLGLGRSSGFKLVRAGDLTAYKVGRCTYISRRAQADFIAKRERQRVGGSA
jgi:hypothetical protein